MTTELRITTDAAGGWTVLRAEGEIDIASVDTLLNDVDRAIVQGSDSLLFDLAGVSFMDSTGLRVIVTSRQCLSETGGRIGVVAGNGPVRRLLEVSGLENSLPLYDSLGDATSS